MKRDSFSIAAPTTPVLKERRHSREVLDAALIALSMREYTERALQEHLQQQHPDRHLHMPSLVRRLLAHGEAEIVDDTLGLTVHGEDMAARARARHTPVPSPIRHTELQHRMAALAPALVRRLESDGAVSVHADACTLLTRGQPHSPASAADLATPPLRAGSLDHERHPSRFGNRLHYRDGRVVGVGGKQ